MKGGASFIYIGMLQHMIILDKTTRQLLGNLIGVKDDLLPEFSNFRELVEELPNSDLTVEQKEKIMIFLELYYRDCPVVEKMRVRNSKDIYDLTHRSMEDLTYEEMKILFLDAKNYVTSIKTVSKGSSTGGIVTPKEIFREAILKAAVSIAIVHNHPDGDSMMSKADISFTKQLIEVGELMSIPIIDHVIIGKNEWTAIMGKARFKIIENKIVREFYEPTVNHFKEIAACENKSFE